MVQSAESFLRKDPTRSSGTNPVARCPLLKSEMRAVFKGLDGGEKNGENMARLITGF
jgi:hypothetical protein